MVSAIISSMNKSLALWLPKPILEILVSGLIYLGMLFRKQLIGPRFLQLSIAAGCNHDCPFCITDVHGKGAYKNKSPLSMDQLKGLIDDALNDLTIKFNILSNGEPTLSPQFKDLCEYIHKKSKGKAEIKVVTNGTNLKKLGIDFFQKINLNVWLSLHSPCFETWQKIHQCRDKDPKKSFSELLSFIKEISRYSKITFHNVLTKESVNTWSDYPSLLKEISIEELHFGDLSGYEELSVKTLSKDELLKIQNLFDDLESIILKEKLVKKHNIHFAREIIKRKIEDLEEAMDKDKDSPDQSDPFYLKNKCYINWIFCFVTENGDVLTCYPGINKGTLKKTNFRNLFYQNLTPFIKNGGQIQKSGGLVPGCKCDECPHIETNLKANQLLP